MHNNNDHKIGILKKYDSKDNLENQIQYEKFTQHYFIMMTNES